MVKKWKKEEVKDLADKIKKYSIFGIADMYKMPAAQLQEIRKKLKGDVEIKMSKKTLMRRALKKAGIKDIESYFRGQPSFVFTNINPFELYKILQKNKTKAEAKEGDIVPEDVEVKEGSTGLPPGPAIGQLQKQGIQTAVEEGEIKIKRNKTVVKEGEEINKELAEILSLLNIKPIYIGINLLMTYENGDILDKDILAIDKKEYIGKIQKAYGEGLNLALNSSYFTKETVEILINKVFTEAKFLALEAEIFEPEVMENIVKKAASRAKKLKGLMG